MYKYQCKKIIDYPSDLIYKILVEVEKYPEFIPNIHKVTKKESFDDKFDATFEIHWNGIKKDISISYHLEHNMVTLKLISAPYLTDFSGFIEIVPRSKKTEIYMDFKFLFENVFVQSMIQPFMYSASTTIFKRLNDRAKQLS